jgi:hypothetical protein
MYLAQTSTSSRVSLNRILHNPLSQRITKDMPLSTHSILTSRQLTSPDTTSVLDDNSYYKVNKANLRNRSQSNRKNIKIKNINLIKSKSALKKKKKFKALGT